MDWLQFIAGIGVGTLGAKLLDIIWLQRRQDASAHQAWLRDRRLEAFTEVIKELWSFGLHEGEVRTSFQTYGAMSKALLLLDDDALADQIDRFVVNMDRMNRLSDRNTPEAGEEGEQLYLALIPEARAITKLLRNVVLHGHVRSCQTKHAP